jgi:hypothetical protein
MASSVKKNPAEKSWTHLKKNLLDHLSICTGNIHSGQRPVFNNTRLTLGEKFAPMGELGLQG